ncbi:MAG: 6-bladed beta-propeller [Alistipes sp.]|jgi:hypothetical protein|nr:6-bladed beta-propeller [Alistipes sp.]
MLRGKVGIATLIAGVVVLAGCGSGGARKVRFADGVLGGKPVAERVAMPDGGELVVADINAFRDSITLPLSMLVEELEIIPLESRNEALFQSGNVTVSDNYIGIATNVPRSFKLFDRSGKYLRDIGHEGRGPGEYGMIYSAAIDEESQTIYILPWQTEQLLVFGIDGSIRKPVKLAYGSSKGVFDINADGTISLATLPFGSPVWAWTQDREGNVINEIANPAPERHVDFSSEIVAGRNAGGFDPYMMIFGNPSSDTLGRYDVAAGRVRSLFTVKNILSKRPPYYMYGELPGHFYGRFAPGMEQVGANVSQGLPPQNFIVDKETLQGAFFGLAIDELGGLDVGDWPEFSQGYYIGNFTTIGLKRQLGELIASGRIPDPDVLQRVVALNDSLLEEDNNVVLLGKLRNN